MPEDIEWDEYHAAGERPFRLIRPSGTVPGVLWSPPVVGSPPPLVLLGPGSDQLKVPLARSFVARAGYSVLALDGASADDAPSSADDARLSSDDGLDRLTAEWLAAVDAVVSLGLGSADRLAYWGLSAGASLGLPLAAALGSRLRCAVLGKFGLRRSSGGGSERAAADAQRVTVPTLFHVQWNDELFPAAGQLELFTLLGAAEKRLIGYPGGHDVTLPVAVAEWQSFIVHHLTTP